LWRHTGRPKASDAPQRIAPKHAAILATRAVDQMTEEQQKLLERFGACCPDALLLRSYALDFREALATCEAWRMMAWVDSAKYSRFGPLVRFAYGFRKMSLPSTPPSRPAGALAKWKVRSIA
jgi:hypothetical protein